MPDRRSIFRLLALAGFLLTVALALWLAELRPLLVIVVMAVALLVAWVIEWLSWRQDVLRRATESLELEEEPDLGTVPLALPPPVPDAVSTSVPEREPEPEPEPVEEPIAPEQPPRELPPAEPEAPEPAPEPELPVAAPEPAPEPEVPVSAPEPVSEPEPEPEAEPEPEPAPEAEPEPVAVPVAPRPVPEPVRAAPEPTPEPRPALRPVPPPAEFAVPQRVRPAAGAPEVVDMRTRATAAPRRWNLWDLERRARDEAQRNPARYEEWSYLFVHLRQFATPDGSLPTEFDALVRESFGELLEYAG